MRRFLRKLRHERRAIARTQGIIAIVLLLVAAAAGAYLLSSGVFKSGSGAIDLSIVESDPVNQIDSFVPENITASHGTTITVAVQNGDDEARNFEIAAFNVNQTISSGATMRITFTVGQAGVYPMFLPATPPFNGFKASPSITGYLIVT
jgi:hypothetical protein